MRNRRRHDTRAVERLRLAIDCLPVATREAMLSGLPTIGPRWGGNLSFMDDGNSILVDGRLTPVDPQSADEWPYFSGQTWFEADTMELQLAMRRVASTLSPSVSQAMNTASSLVTSFSTEKIGAQMKSALARFA